MWVSLCRRLNGQYEVSELVVMGENELVPIFSGAISNVELDRAVSLPGHYC